MAGPKKSVALSGVSVAETSICSIDPDEGVLMYRGYDIAELTNVYTGDDHRVRLILQAVRDKVEDPGRMRALGFCVSIQHADGTAAATVNQKRKPPQDDLFISLGAFRFDKDKPAVISIRNDNTDGITGADAVQLLPK